MRPSLTSALAASLLAAAAACGGAAHPRAPEPESGPDLSPALAPIDWMVGDWAHDGGDEHWVATAGVLYGVAFHPDGSYELMIVDDADRDAEGKPDGKLRLYAMPNGAPPTLFAGANDTPTTVVFANPQHDDPTSITYTTTTGGLTATVAGPHGSQDLELHAVDGTKAPDAEAADLAFAKDTDADRARGWARWFADDGAMIRGDRRLEGPAAAHDAIAPLLASSDLLWAPVWSRASADGKLAVTVGRARIVSHAAVTWRGSYLTLWRHDPAGWRVLADVGRGENPL
ncbi:MAG TPA: hypothetical protein VHE35_34740 [Kofleriaceae bacterium]|nr:hypothetical protein [Kofleriaceae bacterium]